MVRLTKLLALAAVLVVITAAAQARPDKEVTLKGTITCAKCGSMKVKISAKGGGITFGKSEVIGGTGRFYGATSVEDCLGSYAQSEAHAGAGKSSDAQALTKGDINLTLVGTGKGVDVGFAFGKFTIEKV